MKTIMRYIHIITFAFSALMLNAQNSPQEQKYRRSSLYSILVNHGEQKFASEIQQAFLATPIPEKFNDQDLSVKILTVSKNLHLNDKKERQQMEISESTINDSRINDVDKFLIENHVASRLVAKWFNRDYETGACNMDLVKDRGLYDASKFDMDIASRSSRGMALLEDAGEDLIGKTFVTVNDIRYIDKEKGAKAAGGILRVAGMLASAYTGIDYVDNLTDNVASIVESIKGFRVKINTYLYQLVWDEETSSTFYQEQYVSDPSEVSKRDAFEANRGKYKLKYLGRVESAGSTTSVMGVNLDNPINMVRKACQRALDENIADLQHAYEEFRVKTPLVNTSPITAYIGMKEGIKENSKFEVLERQEDEKGHSKYRRVAVITPMKNLIWDNRYMAAEEYSPASALGCTTFKLVSGGNLAPGMMIREIVE